FICRTSPRHPISTLFPYTTLFRSYCRANRGDTHLPCAQQRDGLSADFRRFYFSDLRRSHSVTIFVGSMASLSSCISTTLPSLSIDRKSTRLNSSHSQISYAVFCLK